MKRIPWIISISAIALAALIFLQLEWLMQSKELIDEQFNQKVKMALCYAVSNLTNEPAACLAGETLPSNLPFNEAELDKALSEALFFYDINMEYELQVLEQEPASPTTCALPPFDGGQPQYLDIAFPGKTKYILGKLWFMLVSSILILVFVSLVFILTNYSLLRQKRISEINIDFFNNMAHEFKTPLANIQLASHLMGKNPNPSKSSTYLGLIRKESAKLNEQIERVLQLARMENGKYQLEHQDIDLIALLKSVVEDMQLQVSDRGGSIRVEADPEGISIIRGDPFHLGNAFRNLIDNALKYADHQPELLIRVKTNQEEVTIHFQDNGIGISKTDQAIIFDKFKRVSRGNIHNFKGFGLGLAYVKTVMDLHKGMIRILSDDRRGSRFL